MKSKTVGLLEDWFALRDLSFTEALARFDVSAEDAEIDLGYGDLENLTGLGDLPNHPGFFYFRDGSFVLFYVDKMDDVVDDLQRQELLDFLGEPEAVWRSNVGKRQMMYVYAEKGIAFSASDDEVTFVEVFNPLSLAEYKAKFYVSPSDFAR